MKCLTVCQPWAWALIHGPKRIENRRWATTYRGPLLIHSGKSRDWLGSEAGYTQTEWPAHKDHVFGAIVGVVNLVNCVSIEHMPVEDFAEGPYCWLLLDAFPLPEPVPYSGARGLFDVDLGEFSGPAYTAIYEATGQVSMRWHQRKAGRA